MVKSNPSFDKKLFEKVMVYNCLVDHSYLESIIEYVKPSFFQNDDIKVVFGELVSFYLEYKKVPNITELKIHITDVDKRTALKNVVLSFGNIDKKYDRDVLLKITERFLKEKLVLQTVQSTTIDIQAGEIDSAKILKDFEKACSISLIDSLGCDYLEYIDQHCLDLQKVFETISTGWTWLDQKMGGGFQAMGRALYVFFGATNVGKSIFLGNIATNVLAQDKTVVLISLEMPETVYTKRVSACLSEIPMDNLKDNTDTLKTILNSYKETHPNAKLIVKEFPPKSVSPLHIRAYIHKLIRQGIKPDLIVLDYLNLLAPVTSGIRHDLQITEITELIRALSYEVECSIVSATQANRSAYKEASPAIDSTSESIGIATTADVQISIWTEEGDMDLGIIHYSIVKNRFGSRGCKSILNIDYPTLSLKNPDQTSLDFSPNDKKITGTFDEIDGQELNIMSTLDMIEKLGNMSDD